MIEAGGNEIDDETMFNAIMAGHEENKKIVKFIQGIVDEVGKPKFEYESSDPDPEIMKEIEDFCIEDVKKALDTDDKLVRDEALLPIYNAVHEKFDERFEANEGIRTSTRELTAEALTKSVLLTQRLTFFQEHTAQVFSQEVKHRYFQLLLSVRCQTLSFLTVLMSRLKRDISITTTSRHTP